VDMSKVAREMERRNNEADTYVPPVTPVSQRLWTLLSPWEVATSPFDGDIVPVATFARAEDAMECVGDHNREVARAEDKARADREAEAAGDLIDRVYDRERDRRAGL
jgi:hypothetical protein